MGRQAGWRLGPGGRIDGNYNLVFNLHPSTLVIVINQYLGRNNRNNRRDGKIISRPDPVN